MDYGRDEAITKLYLRESDKVKIATGAFVNEMKSLRMMLTEKIALLEERTERGFGDYRAGNSARVTANADAKEGRTAVSRATGGGLSPESRHKHSK